MARTYGDACGIARTLDLVGERWALLIVRELLLGTWRGRISIAIIALFVFIAIFGTVLAPYDPNASSLDVLAPPSFDHILGTTENGADVFSQILWRISRAQLMLASTQMPVQRIATELDFNQVNYFSRVFRAHTGLSPSEYRRQSASREGRPAGVSLPAHHHTLLRT